MPAGGWYEHPSEADSVDVAATFLSPLVRGFPVYTPIPVSIFATDKRIAEYNIGLGNETITIGLFSGFTGTARLTPLVRTGTIAMMPREKLGHPRIGDIDAFLVEGLSMNHQSGSPVLVRSGLSQPVFTADGQRYDLEGGGPLHFLGLLQGHYDTEPLHEREVKQNMGVTIVIPARKVLETLYHPSLVEFRAILDDPAKVERF